MSRPTPVIVYLSGHLRGRTHRLAGEHLRIGTHRGADIRVLPRELPPGAEEKLHDGEIAILVLCGETYELEVLPGGEVWVDGERVRHRVLASGDVLEIGEGGPVLRFRLYPAGSPAYKSMAEVFSDCRDCARHGGRNALDRAGILLAGAPVGLATQTAPSVRLSLLLIAAVFVGTAGTLWIRNLDLEHRLAEETARVEGLAGLLERDGGTVSMKEVAAERRALEERVEALEARAGSRQRVISAAAASVVFLQGGYGFVEAASGRPLRLKAPITEQTRPEEIEVTLEGDGPLAEVFYTGTAFVATPDGLLVTNRHVAQPWEFDATARAVADRGFTPVMRRFVGYLPGVPSPFEVELLALGESSDVAVLRGKLEPNSGVAPLELTDHLPKAGEEVLVLGYPTGMQALLARADPAFVEELLGSGSLDFWELARRLSAAGHIAPLATLGIVGQVSPGSVVYDAETTHGGSGGPVLDLDGKVVAVNAAIMPEFGGSNLGVPAGEADRLLESVRTAAAATPDATSAVAPTEGDVP